jgi:biopolymer transport protein ExbD
MGAGALSTGDDEDAGIVAEINITPLTDIFLVLLIIFMVTTTAATDESKNVQLPTATESATPEDPTSVYITMTAEGKLKINDFLVQPGELELMIQEALDESSDKVVVLRGDKRVPLGEAVKILDLSQRLGAKSVAIATEQPDQPRLSPGPGA